MVKTSLQWDLQRNAAAEGDRAQRDRWREGFLKQMIKWIIFEFETIFRKFEHFWIPNPDNQMSSSKRCNNHYTGTDHAWSKLVNSR